MLLGSLVNYLVNVPLASGRVFPVKLPQGTALPAIEVRVSSAIHAQKLAGLAGMGTAIVTIDCLSAGGPHGAEQLASSIISLFASGYRGNIGDTHISSLALVGGPEHFEERVDPGTDTTRFVTSLQYQISYQEPCA